MNKLFRHAIPVIFACAMVGTALGQDKPAPVVVARVSMSSYDDVSKTFTDLGLPSSLIANIKAGLETTPFIGAGGFATDKPMGVTVWAADPQKLFPIEASVITSVPIVQGKVTAADLTGQGATALDGIPDGFSMGPVYLRRTADYIHLKDVPSAFGLAQASDTLFAADYKDPANLYVAAADLAALRKAAPNAYLDLARQITALPRIIGIGTTDDPKPVLNVLDKIDTFTMTLSQDPDNLLLKSTLTPSPFSTKPLDLPRPAFPPGTIARLHIVYPTPEAAGMLEKQLASLPEETFAMGMPPVYHQRAKDLILKLASLNSRSAALSMAVSIKDGKPTFYLVDQFTSDLDALQETTDLVNEAVGLAQEGAGEKIDVQGATYTDGTHKVQRVTLTPDAAGGPPTPMVIDEIQTGKTLYVTISPTSNKAVATLADAGMDGRSTMIFAGDLDLGSLMEAAPNATLPGMSAEALQALRKNWVGQKVTLTMQSSDKGLQTSLQAPKQVWRDLIKLGLQQQATPTGQPASGLP